MRNEEFSDLSDMLGMSDSIFMPAMMLLWVYVMLLATPRVSMATWNVRLGSAIADVWMSIFSISHVSVLVVMISLVAR